MDIPSGGIANPSGDTPGLDLSSTPVAQDMESIFGPAELSANTAGNPSRALVPIVDRSRDGARRRGRAGRRWVIPGLVMAGVLALAGGLVEQGLPDDAPVPAAKPMPSAAPRPVVAVETAVPGPAVSPSVSPPRPNAAVRTVARQTESSGRRSRENRSCQRLGRIDLAWCMRPQIVSADRQLRNAYKNAVRAGVGRRALIAYRERWSRLRGQAMSDPRRVAFGYREMAQELDAARTRNF